MLPLSVLVKPASSACDLNCRYCFYKDEAAIREKAFYGQLDGETSEILIKKALGFAGGRCSFLFQGGEPTLRGLDYFENFVALEKKYARPDVKVFNSIQTNGILIDDEWAEFLSKNGFLTGLSLDGSADIHNLNREFPDGSGSFNRVMKAAETLKKHGAPFNILSVVTAQSAKKIEKIYNFFRNSGFDYLQFIPCLEPQEVSRGGSPYALLPEEYGRFLIRLFDLWFRDLQNGKYVSIRYFDNLLNVLRGGRPETCGSFGRCCVQFVIEGDGTVYPCDFYALDGRELGNIKTDTFGELLNSENAKRFVEESLNVPDECKKCKWYGLCRNGCRRDRVFENGMYALNYYCRSYKTFFEQKINALANVAAMLPR